MSFHTSLTPNAVPTNSLHRLLKNRDGGVMPLFALALVPILGFTGAAVDFSRANSVKASMQAALDSTALMLSKDANKLDDTGRQLLAHLADATGRAATGRERVEEGFRAYTTPALIVCGDEDDATLEPGIFLRRVIPTAGLVVLPKCGHTQNLEEPDLFNKFVLAFITRVDAGRWPRRIPESQADSLIAAVRK